MIQLSICNRKYDNELGFANDINIPEIYTNQNLQGMYFYAFYKWKHHIFRLILRYFLNGQKRYDIWLRVAPWNSALLCELSLTFHNIEWRQPHYNQWTQDVFSEDTITVSINIQSQRKHFPSSHFQLHSLSVQDYMIFADSPYCLLPPWSYSCGPSSHPEHLVYDSPEADSRENWFYIYIFKHLKKIRFCYHLDWITTATVSED